jgi:hypothetical protein
MYIRVHICANTHTHTHTLTYILWAEELESPSTESELNHNKENIQRSAFQRTVMLHGLINA